MQMSNLQAIGLALIPGEAEILKKQATACGNMAWDGVAWGIIRSRNGLYFSFALTVIATVGLLLARSMIITCVCASAVVIGTVLTGIFAKGLYDATLLCQQTVNSRQLHPQEL